MSIPDDWQGTLDVVERETDGGYVPWRWNYDDYVPGGGMPYTVNVLGTTISGQSLDLVAQKGLQGLKAVGRLTVKWGDYVYVHKQICPGPPVPLSGPWGEVPWTCSILGETCFSNCSKQFSDPHDADGNGDVHNGHPQCDSSIGVAFCGPCRCGMGEAQTYTTTRLYDLTPALALITCIPCSPGRYKSDGNGSSVDDCHLCDPGSSSTAGATARTACDTGMFANEEALCLSCPAGFFGDAGGQTACKECDDGQYTAQGGLTACKVCAVGSISVDKDAGCELCLPGTVGTKTSTSACVPCVPGTFQTSAGMSECSLCSEVLDISGENSHLWTTMVVDAQGQAAWRRFQERPACSNAVAPPIPTPICWELVALAGRGFSAVAWAMWRFCLGTLPASTLLATCGDVVGQAGGVVQVASQARAQREETTKASRAVNAKISLA